MGEKLAGRGDRVEGLIVARTSDTKLRYALKRLTDVSVRLYRVEFSLHEIDEVAPQVNDEEVQARTPEMGVSEESL